MAASVRRWGEVRVTKKDIVRTISEDVGLTQQQTKEIVQKTFDAIIDSLVREGRVELRNFGVFEVKPRAARKARNPRTGEQVDVPQKHVVTFKPGKHMEAKVRDLDAAAGSGPTTDGASRAGLGRSRRARQRSEHQPTDPLKPEATGAANRQPPPGRPSGRWDLS